MAEAVFEDSEAGISDFECSKDSNLVPATFLQLGEGNISGCQLINMYFDV